MQGNANGAADIPKERQDYAWKWFEYHASQRVTMFNYFLIITGILANAYVGLMRISPGESGSLLDRGDVLMIATALAILGAITSFGFLLLDVRNKELVDMGEAVLENLERTRLFPDCEPGLLKGEGAKRGLKKLISHKVLLPAIELAVAICFILAAILPSQLV